MAVPAPTRLRQRATDARRAPFAVAGALAPLVVTWLFTLNPNCTLAGGTYGGCYLFGHPRLLVGSLFAVPGALAGFAFGLLVPRSWLAAATESPVTAGVFAASGRTLAAVGALVVAVGTAGPFLFAGAATTSELAWLTLSLPYVPALVGYLGLFAVEPFVPAGDGTLAYAVGLAAALAFVAVVTAAQTAWLYWGAGLGRRAVAAAADRLG